MSDPITLATWNVEWATPTKHDAIRERIASWNADILVVTEGDHGVLPVGGHAADAGTDWGYRNTKPHWRKAILWSRWPLREVSTDVPAGVRTGRLVDAVVEAPVEAPVGLIRVLAVCIPWRDAHVRTGIDPHGEQWREHTAMVAHIGRLVAAHDPGTPLVLLGDFNQRLPRVHQPRVVHEYLLQALGPLDVLTAGTGPLPGLDRQEVDHIAVSSHFTAGRVWGVDRHDGDRKLSDHDAVLASVHLP